MYQKIFIGSIILNLLFASIPVYADDISDAKEELNAYEDAQTDAKEMRESLESDLADLEAHLESLNSQIDDVYTSIDDIQTELQEKATDAAPSSVFDIHTWSKNVSEATFDLHTDLEEKENLLDELLDERDKTQSSIDNLTEELTTQNEIIADYDYLTDSVQNTVDKLIEEEQEQELQEKAAQLGESRDADSGEYSVGFQIRYMGRKFAHPCPGYRRYSSGFGPRNAPTAGASTYHKGLDMSASSGTPIYAAESGTVKRAGYSSSNGNYVVIDHGGGVETYYLHASQLYVSAGQTVSRGEKIAAVGSTGISTGPHLHFQVNIDGTPVDPKPYLP